MAKKGCGGGTPYIESSCGLGFQCSTPTSLEGDDGGRLTSVCAARRVVSQTHMCRFYLLRREGAIRSTYSVLRPPSSIVVVVAFRPLKDP